MPMGGSSLKRGDHRCAPRKPWPLPLTGKRLAAVGVPVMEMHLRKATALVEEGISDPLAVRLRSGLLRFRVSAGIALRLSEMKHLVRGNLHGKFRIDVGSDADRLRPLVCMTVPG